MHLIDITLNWTTKLFHFLSHFRKYIQYNDITFL
jgi:hypothetical protein